MVDAHQTRHKKTGRYSYWGQWDRVCVCGETLGNHTAAAPHTNDATNCEKFTPKDPVAQQYPQHGQEAQMTTTTQPKFYEFRQNNSGGLFEGKARYLLIEAPTPEKANEIACDEFDVYFDGVEKGLDCKCCGDRWNPAGEWNFSYGIPGHLVQGDDSFGRRHTTAYLIIAYANGSRVKLDSIKDLLAYLAS